MDRKKLLIVAWTVVSLAGVTAAVATPQTGDVTRNELVVGKVLDNIELQRTEPSDVRIHQVTFNPGSSSGWHTHPGAQMVVVKAGALILQRAPGCDRITVTAGQGVFIPGGTPHLAHNDGPEPAELYTTQIAPTGTTVLREDTDEQCVANQAPDAPEEMPGESSEEDPEAPAEK